MINYANKIYLLFFYPKCSHKQERLHKDTNEFLYIILGFSTAVIFYTMVVIYNLQTVRHLDSIKGIYHLS